MATGYTAAVGEGKMTDFREFAWSCARAFGALILMRDDPMDAPVPERFEPSRYNLDALEKEKTRLARLQAMTLERAEAEAEDEFQRNHESWVRRSIEREAKAARYRAMLAHVYDWQPPTVDHQGLRKFMLEQLLTSIEHDCSGSYDTEPVKQSGSDWHEAQIKQAHHSIGYHAKAWAEEVARTDGRNQWVAALRDSLESHQADPARSTTAVEG